MNIVNPDQDARGQFGQHVEKEDHRVRIREHAVSTVQENDIPVLQVREDVEVGRLDRLPHHTVADRIDLAAGSRIDRHDFRIELSVAARSIDEQGGISRADLDVAARRSFTREAVERRAVDTEQESVVPVRLRWVCPRDRYRMWRVGVCGESTQEACVRIVETAKKLSQPAVRRLSVAVMRLWAGRGREVPPEEDAPSRIARA
jgi:hypothetical protein